MPNLSGRFRVGEPKSNASVPRCTDCRYYVPATVVELSLCSKTGEFAEMERDPKFASVRRCGPNGTLWAEYD